MSRGSNLKEGRSLLVRNMRYETSPHRVRSVFEQYGQIRDVYLPLDHDNRKPRGFGFVEFFDERDAMVAAREMDRTMLDGNEISVIIAQDRRKSPETMRRLMSDPGRRHFGNYSGGGSGGGGGAYRGGGSGGYVGYDYGGMSSGRRRGSSRSRSWSAPRRGDYRGRSRSREHVARSRGRYRSPGYSRSPSYDRRRRQRRYSGDYRDRYSQSDMRGSRGSGRPDEYRPNDAEANNGGSAPDYSYRRDERTDDHWRASLSPGRHQYGTDVPARQDGGHRRGSKIHSSGRNDRIQSGGGSFEEVNSVRHRDDDNEYGDHEQ